MSGLSSSSYLNREARLKANFLDFSMALSMTEDTSACTYWPSVGVTRARGAAEVLDWSPSQSQTSLMKETGTGRHIGMWLSNAEAGYQGFIPLFTAKISQVRMI